MHGSRAAELLQLLGVASCQALYGRSQLLLLRSCSPLAATYDQPCLHQKLWMKEGSLGKSGLFQMWLMHA